jgi:hypothetical protein
MTAKHATLIDDVVLRLRQIRNFLDLAILAIFAWTSLLACDKCEGLSLLNKQPENLGTLFVNDIDGPRAFGRARHIQ